MSRQIALPLSFGSGGAGNEFFVTDANRAAAEQVQRWADWQDGALILVGPAGSGKSQLARLVAGSSGGRLHLHEDADRANFDETALFHALNRARQGGAHLLITARTPPGEWRVALPDLRSRLLALPMTRIAPPDEPLIAELLAQKLRVRGLDVAPEVIEFLEPRTPRTYTALDLLAGRLDEAALERQHRLTVPLAKAVLQTLDTGIRDGTA